MNNMISKYFNINSIHQNLTDLWLKLLLYVFWKENLCVLNSYNRFFLKMLHDATFLHMSTFLLMSQHIFSSLITQGIESQMRFLFSYFNDLRFFFKEIYLSYILFLFSFQAGNIYLWQWCQLLRRCFVKSKVSQ